MTKFVPPYPQPMPDHGRFIKMMLRPVKFLRSLHCSLSSLMVRSYSMHMGEVGLPHKKVYVANQPDLVQRVLIDDIANFPKSEVVADMFGTLVGDGLIVSNGEIWKRQRRIMAPVFEQTRNKLVFDLMMGAVDDMMARFETIADGPREAMVDEEMTHVTADVIYRTIFGEELGADDAKRTFGAFQSFQEAAFAHGMARMVGLPAFAASGGATARKEAKIIHDLLDPKVKERYDAFHHGETLDGKDILDALIAAKDPQDGSRFDLRELNEQVACCSSAAMRRRPARWRGISISSPRIRSHRKRSTPRRRPCSAARNPPMPMCGSSGSRATCSAKRCGSIRPLPFCRATRRAP